MYPKVQGLSWFPLNTNPRKGLGFRYPEQRPPPPKLVGGETKSASSSPESSRRPPQVFGSGSSSCSEDRDVSFPREAVVVPSFKRTPLPGTTTGRIVMDGQTGNGPRRPRAFFFSKAGGRFLGGSSDGKLKGNPTSSRHFGYTICYQRRERSRTSSWLA